MILQSSGVKRQNKIAEWEERIALLHKKYPRLEEIGMLIANHSLLLALTEVGKNKSGRNKEELMQEQNVLMLERKEIIKQNNLPENVYDIWWECKQCQDTGFIKPGEKCSCRAQELFLERWQNCGLSPVQEKQNFGNYSLEWYLEKKKPQENLRDCIVFAEKISTNQFAGNLFLYGTVGTGKTHLCSAIANYVMQAGKSVIYLKSGHLLDLIRQYRLNSTTEEASFEKKLQNIHRVDLLIIDDLGTENTSDFVKEQLFLLIDERINNRVPWVISTNLTPNEIGTMYEDRLSDRILGMAQILKFEGESIRRQKKMTKK